jgi:putative spermidine/putrescine transport system permease protein
VSTSPHTPTRLRDRPRPGRVLLIVVAALVGAWMLVPTLAVVPLSFTGSRTFQFPPKSWSTEWYANVADDGSWLSAFTNSLLIACLSAILATLLGTAAAFAVRTSFLGRQIAYGVLLAPMIVPVVIIAIATYSVFLPWGLTGTRAGFVAAHTVMGIPFVVVTVIAGLQNLDPRLPAAASTLGATPYRTFATVTLPLILPSVLSGALFAFVASFDEAVISLFLVSPRLRTLPVALYEGVTREIDPTVAAVSTLILLATTLVLAVGVVIQTRRTVSDGTE